KNATFTPKVAQDRAGSLPEGAHTEITVPCFLLLHLEPNAPIVGLPYYENPFFWSWVGLVVFGAAFFLVMHKIEKRESTQMRDQNLRLRRRRRELDAARAPGAGEAVAVGGGAALDVAGCAAATTRRGLPWVAVPTSVVAQADASVGGKTGINHPRGKNLLGTFHPPALVVADVTTLRTLPPRDLT